MSEAPPQSSPDASQQNEKRAATGRNAVLALMGDRDFFTLWLGQMLSQVGDRFRFVAVLVIVNDLTGGDPLAITVLTFTVVVPQFLFGLLGGAVSDRVDRKTVMIVSDVLRGVLVLPVLLVDNPARLWIIYIGSIGMEIISVFFYPARNAVIPNIIGPGQLMTANALMQGSYIVALIVGSTLAGYLTALLGTGFAIVFDAVTFFLSAGAIALMAIPPLAAALHGVRPTPAELWREIKAGLRFIQGRRDLLMVLVVTAVAMLGLGSIIVLGISYLETRLNVAAEGYGNTVASMGIGLLIGGLLISRIAGRVPANVLVGGSLVLVGVAMIAFAGAGSYTVVIIAAVVIGLCLVIARASLDTFTQALVPNGMLGRVQATVQMTLAVSTAIAHGLAGILAKLLDSVESVFFLAGCITMIAGLTAILTLREAAREMAKSELVRAPR
ncbi:MAG: MFS transporter [Anaerolineae bacterium]|nr:MAG: MFS transporter [Anaerolineae bacterium]